MMGGMAGAMGTALQAQVNTAALSRKIIYDGEIDLIVKDVDPIAKQVVTFIQDARLHRRHRRGHQRRPDQDRLGQSRASLESAS